jgi:hypothetical protein
VQLNDPIKQSPTLMLLYTPPLFIASDQSITTLFTFHLIDEMDFPSNSATVTINIAAEYSIPIAQGAQYTMLADTVRLITLEGSSTNFTRLSANITSLPTNGRLRLCTCPCVNRSGSALDDVPAAVFGRTLTAAPYRIEPCSLTDRSVVYYVPNLHVAGRPNENINHLLLMFTFRVFDGAKYSAPLTDGVQRGTGVQVLLHVLPVANYPSAFNLSFKNVENVAQTILFKTSTLTSVLKNRGGNGISGYNLVDASILQVQIMSWPANGVLYLTAGPAGLGESLNALSDGILPYVVPTDTGVTLQVVYMPNLNWWGEDSFRFRMMNRNNFEFASARAIVSLNTTFVLHRPVVPLEAQQHNLTENAHLLIRLPYTDVDGLAYMPGSPQLKFTVIVMKPPKQGRL